MIPKQAGIFKVALFAALFLLLPAPPAAAETLTGAMREADPRLQRTVSLSANGVYTAELLKLLADQTGVSLTAREDDGASDVRVTAVLREVPLADVMDSLWSLVSYRNARWHWWRRGNSGSYDYVLMRPRNAQLLAARLRAAAQQEFENHADRMLAALDMTPAERQALKAVDRSAGIIDTSRYNRGGLTAFRELLTSEQRQQVLRGQPIKAPLSSAPDAVKQFTMSEWNLALPNGRTRLDGKQPTTPASPSYLAFSADRRPRRGNCAPTLFIFIEGIGGFSYLGGWQFQEQLRDELHAEWMNLGDQPKSEKGEKKLEAPSGEAASKSAPDGWQPAVAERLRQVAAAAPLSFIARLDMEDRHDPGSPGGRTVEEFLKRLREAPPHYQSKWRNDMLLITYPSWFITGTGATDAPFPVMQELRAAQELHQGLLPLELVAKTATALTEEQLLLLANEFPALRAGAYLRGIFLAMGKSPRALDRLRSPRGLPLSTMREHLAQVPMPELQRALSGPGAVGLRMVEETTPVDRTIWLELLDAGRKAVRIIGSRHPRAPAAPAAAGRDTSAGSAIRGR